MRAANSATSASSKALSSDSIGTRVLDRREGGGGAARRPAGWRIGADQMREARLDGRRYGRFSAS